MSCPLPLICWQQTMKYSPLLHLVGSFSSIAFILSPSHHPPLRSFLLPNHPSPSFPSSVLPLSSAEHSARARICRRPLSNDKGECKPLFCIQPCLWRDQYCLQIVLLSQWSSTGSPTALQEEEAANSRKNNMVGGKCSLLVCAVSPPPHIHTMHTHTQEVFCTAV